MASSCRVPMALSQAASCRWMVASVSAGELSAGLEQASTEAAKPMQPIKSAIARGASFSFVPPAPPIDRQRSSAHGFVALVSSAHAASAAVSYLTRAVSASGQCEAGGG